MKSLMFTPPAQAEALFDTQLFDTQENLWRADRSLPPMPWLDDDAFAGTSGDDTPPEGIPEGLPAEAPAAPPPRRSH